MRRPSLFFAAALLPAAFAGSVRAQAEDFAIAAPNTNLSADNAIPGRDAVIPQNARLVAFDGQDIADLAFQRVHGDGTIDALTFDRFVWSTGAAYVVKLGALSSAEGVSVQPTCSGSCFDTFTFTVVDSDDTTAPTFAETGRTRFTVTPQEQSGPLGKSTTGYFVSGCLPRIHDDNATFLQLDIADGDKSETELLPLQPSTATCGTPLSFTIPGGDDRSVCFDGTAVDVAGNASEPQHTCVDLKSDDAGGCAQAGRTEVVGGIVGLATIGVGFRRRRAMTRPGA